VLPSLLSDDLVFNGFGRVTVLVNDGPQLIRCHRELLAPVADLMIFVAIDVASVLLAALTWVVCLFAAFASSGA
jgi:hypothetical protein